MRSIKYKILVFFSAIALIILSGCGLIYDDLQETDTNSESPAILVLRINKIASSTRYGQEEPDVQAVKEEIRSLRIIMINENNLIEVNEFIPSEQLNADPSEIYTFIRKVSPGQKNFFILANEEKVTNFSGVENPDGSSLTQILDSYNNKILNGEELAIFLNSISFSPVYEIIDGSVAFPYSSFYSLNLEAGKKYDNPMYLVPVATKYNVNIINKRKEKVFIKELYINSIADKNYLLPQVGVGNYYMNGTYWIDWLEKVAEESQKNSDFEDNQDFNEEWGWITDYKLPENTTHTPVNLIKEEGVYVDAQTPVVGGEPEAGSLAVPVFYKPESLNLSANGKGIISQSYSVKMKVQAEGSEEEVELTRSLSNVKALFRNTHLILNIEFSEGYMHVYGEIAPWSLLDMVNGFVTEETEK